MTSSLRSPVCKKEIMFAISKAVDYKLVSTRRPTVMSLSLQKGFPELLHILV
jgi:hypothetical protein